MISVDELYALSTLLGSAAAILLLCIVYQAYREADALGKKILKKKAEIDNVENKVQGLLKGGPVMQSRFDKMVKHEKVPLEKELETLKLQRQFVLDKIPLLSFFKR